MTLDLCVNSTNLLWKFKVRRKSKTNDFNPDLPLTMYGLSELFFVTGLVMFVTAVARLV